MTAAFHAKALSARLKPLHAERDSRLARGVPVPPGLTEAIKTIEGQLANEYNRHEVEENLPEAEFMALQEPKPWPAVDTSWRWYLAGAAVCLALAAWIHWGLS
jgi:hypothetical protein